MWTPCRVMHVLYVCSAKGSMSFTLRVKDKLYFCFFLHVSLLWLGTLASLMLGGGVKHQAVQCCGGVVRFV